MKTYLVAAALIRHNGDILLVQQQGADDPIPVWSLPGGVVEAGELLTEAVAREVREETGLEAEAVAKLSVSPDPTMRDPILAYLYGEVSHGAVWLFRDDTVIARFGLAAP